MMTKEPSIRSRRDRNACTLHAASMRRHLNRTTDTAGQDCIDGWQMLLSSDCRYALLEFGQTRRPEGYLMLLLCCERL